MSFIIIIMGGFGFYNLHWILSDFSMEIHSFGNTQVNIMQNDVACRRFWHHEAMPYDQSQVKPWYSRKWRMRKRKREREFHPRKSRLEMLSQQQWWKTQPNTFIRTTRLSRYDELLGKFWNRFLDLSTPRAHDRSPNPLQSKTRIKPNPPIAIISFQ